MQSTAFGSSGARRRPRGGLYRSSALAIAGIAVAILALAPRPAPAAVESGVLDPDFGAGGKLVVPLGPQSKLDEAFAVAVRNDGLILVAGYGSFQASAGGKKLAALRVLSDGTPDGSFQPNGIATIKVGDRGEAHAIALDGAQRIVLGGWVVEASKERFAVARLLETGEPDPSFGGGDGSTTTLFEDRTARASALALQGDGKIVLAGWSRDTNRDVSLARYDATGNLDPDFGSGGKAILPLGNGNDEALAIAIDAEGRIVLAGVAFDGSDADLLVARLLPNGTLDMSFAGTGFLRLALGGAESGQAIALQPDGKILVAGTVTIGGIDHFATVRLHPDGTLDSSFDGDGKAVTDIGEEAQGRAIALRARGRFLVAGQARFAGKTNFAVAQFRADGSLDPTFGSLGVLAFPMGNRADEANAMALQPDGNAVLAGTARTGSNADFGIARVLADDCGDAILDPGEECDGDDIGGASCCSPECKIVAADTVCRAAASGCDVAETCDGVSDLCPADVVADAGALCRAAAGDCDVAESCDGIAPVCPPDERVAQGTSCRPSAGDCDVAESCDGVAAQCPADDLVVAGTVCRAAVDACDEAETCGGTSAECPADALATAGTVCREAAGTCDVAETCDGASAACPADVLIVAGTECRGAAGGCDVAESCDGASPGCPADALADAGTVCRGAAGDCDVPETCDGATAQCPADAIAEKGAVCRAKADACDLRELCGGTSIECPEDRRRPDRDGDGVCNIEDVCPQVSDPSQADADGDGIGDACEPCTGGVTLTGALLQIANYATPFGDDTFKLKGNLKFDTTPALSPATTGARLAVQDANGRLIYDYTAPPGAMDELGVGWRTNLAGTVHTYKGPPTLAGLVDKIQIATPANRPGLVKMSVIGKKPGGSHALLPVALPLRAILVPDATASFSGICGERGFEGPAPAPVCAFDATSSKLTCR